MSYPGLADPSPISFKGKEGFRTQFAGETRIQEPSTAALDSKASLSHLLSRFATSSGCLGHAWSREFSSLCAPSLQTATPSVHSPPSCPFLLENPARHRLEPS